MAAPRKTTARKTVVRKPTRAEVASYKPPVDPDPVEAVKAEARALDADWLTVPIGGVDVRIAPITQWPGAVYDGITETGVMSVAALSDIVHPDDVEEWAAIWGDLLVGERIEAITAIMAEAGQSMGGSRASRRSSIRGHRK